MLEWWALLLDSDLRGGPKAPGCRRTAAGTWKTLGRWPSEAIRIRHHLASLKLTKRSKSYIALRALKLSAFSMLLVFGLYWMVRKSEGLIGRQDWSVEETFLGWGRCVRALGSISCASPGSLEPLRVHLLHPRVPSFSGAM